jgi:hypothetical protein
MTITKVSTGLIEADAASVNLNIDENTLYIDVTTNRVGIGNTNPSTALDVTGSVTADGLTNNGDVVFSKSTTGVPIIKMSGFALANSPYGIINFYNEDGSQQGPNNAVQIKALAKNSDGSGGELAFHTSTGTGSEGADAVERLRIDASGNVGIGASSPSSTFRASINGDGSSVIGGIEFRNAASGGSTFTIGHASATSPSATLNVVDAANLIFKTSNAEAMRIDASGNVGIGTNSPASSTGYTVLTLNNATNGGNIVFQSNGTAKGYVYNSSSQFRIEAGASTPIVFANPNGEAMRIDASGNVEIGDNTFTAGKLRVYDTAGNHIWLKGRVSDGTSSVSFRNNADNTYNGRIEVADTGGMLFQVAGGERMRLDVSGNLLVRQSSAAVSDTHNGGTVEQFWGNQFSSSNSTNTKVMIGSGSNEGYVGASRLSSSGKYVINSYLRFDNTNATAGSDAGQILFFTQTGGTNAAERMRIDSSGTIRTTSSDGTAPTIGSGCVSVQGRSNSASVGILRLYKTGDDGNIVDFYRTGNTLVGKITVSETTTSYVTSSDYRLKENVVGMSGATERLKQLKPSRFNFIADADTTVDGFLAHEVQDIVPEAITGTKDAVDADGNPEYQGIDQSKLVPLLVATIQELEARIAALES